MEDIWKTEVSSKLDKENDSRVGEKVQAEHIPALQEEGNCWWIFIIWYKKKSIYLLQSAPECVKAVWMWKTNYIYFLQQTE